MFWLGMNIFLHEGINDGALAHHLFTLTTHDKDKINQVKKIFQNIFLKSSKQIILKWDIEVILDCR